MLEEVREAEFARPEAGEDAVVPESVLGAGAGTDPAESAVEECLGAGPAGELDGAPDFDDGGNESRGTEIEAGPDEVAGIFVAGAEGIAGAEDVPLLSAALGEDALRERRK